MNETQINPKEQRRADAKALRSAMPQQLCEQFSNEICKRITNMASFGLCDIILCYCPLSSEVDVLPIASAALARGKTVAFPVSDSENGTMEFYRVDDLSELCEVGAFGIKEPKKDESRLVTPTQSTMIIMPGLLFDNHGRRIGYGGGYYDNYIRRYPALFRSSMTVGVTYSALFSDTPIPYTDRDISVAIVVTEKGINFVRKIEKSPKREVRRRHYVPLVDAAGNPAEPKKREYYNANYVSPDEGKYKKPNARTLLDEN